MVFPPRPRSRKRFGQVNRKDALDDGSETVSENISFNINDMEKSPKNRAMPCDWRMTAIQGDSGTDSPQTCPQFRWTTSAPLRKASFRAKGRITAP
jgi:hypothetical protein